MILVLVLLLLWPTAAWATNVPTCAQTPNCICSASMDSLAEFDTQIGISGTASSSTYWRGDNAWDAIDLGTDTNNSYVDGVTSGGGLTLTGTEGGDLGMTVGTSTGDNTHEVKLWIDDGTPAWENRHLTSDFTITASDVSLASTFSEFGVSVDDTELTAEDFGDFTCTGVEDQCTLDSGVVANAELAANAVTTDKISDSTIFYSDLNRTNLLLGAYESWFYNTGAAGFVVFEGSNTGAEADYEGFLGWLPTAKDQYIWLPDIGTDADGNDTVALLQATQEFTNKTINGGTFSGTITATAGEIDVNSGTIDMAAGESKAATFNATGYLIPAAVSLGGTAGTGATVCMPLPIKTMQCAQTGGCSAYAADFTNFPFSSFTFSGIADNTGAFNFATPQNITGTTGSINLTWYATNAACDNTDTADDVCWTVQMNGFSDHDSLNGSLGTAVGTTTRCYDDLTLNKTTITSVTHGMSATKPYSAIKLLRDVDGGTTGCTADGFEYLAILLSAEFCYEVDEVLSGE